MTDVEPLPSFTKRYGNISEAKASGSTYTPPALADFVAKHILEAATLPRRRIRVLDPAVGDGSLLVALLARLEGYDLTVVGFDTNPAAIEATKVRLSGLCPRAKIELHNSDFLEYSLSKAVGSQSSLFAAMPEEPFDLIIANPPYVRTQIMGSKLARGLAERFGLSGRVDAYYAFVVAMGHVLAPDGAAGVIVSNRFMTTRSGSSVRRALLSQYSLRQLWDLGDTKLFEAAVLPAVLVALGRGEGQPSAPPLFTSVYETDSVAIAHSTENILDSLDEAGVKELPDGRRFQVIRGSLNSGQNGEVWRLATASSDEWLAKVTRHTRRHFGDIGKVRVGVKTCADKVFIRRNWDDMPVDERPELLRPLTTHHIAARYRPRESESPMRILYPHESVNNQRLTSDLSQYPRSARYLENHRKTLEGRKYVTNAGRKWYEIWVPQDPAAWKLPKLVFRDISERPTFWIDLTGSVVNGDCYWIAPDAQENTDLIFLAAAVANSTFIEAFYDRRFNNKLYSGRRRFITQYVEKFPLPDETTAIAQQIIGIARELAKDGEDDRSTALNSLVWEAFGLGVEEGVG